MNAAPEEEQEYGLFLQDTDQIPAAVVNLLRLLLNYRYGLDVLTEKTIQEALPVASRYGNRVRTIFIVRDEPIENRNSLMALGRRGSVPLFLLVPRQLVDLHKQLCKGLKNIFVCAWEDAAAGANPSLQQVVTAVFDQQKIGHVLIDEKEVAPELLQQRLEHRLKHINTLPTLPDIVLRLTALLNDPATQMEDLEELLVTDPSIVHRLLKVVNSPVFAGRRTNGEWTLREAVVRLGLKQVGAIAQQLKLINNLIKPENNSFDINRFWRHSVGCAVIADKLYVEKLLPLKESIAVDKYWIGALLHDIGKLVMGFFFWDAFSAILKRMSTPKTPFHWAEARLDVIVTHEYITRIVLTRAKADPDVIEAVAAHNSVGRRPNDLICLLHVADNLCKDLGMGYLEKERAVYSPAVLSALEMTEEQMEELIASVGEKMADEIEDLVTLCIAS